MRKDVETDTGYDYFGTYLRSVRSTSVANRLLENLSKESMIVSDLATNIGGSADELVDAIIRAEKAGYIRLAKTDDDTIVSLTETGRKLVGMAKKKTT